MRHPLITLLLAACLWLPSLAAAQGRYPLEFISPRPSGTDAVTQMDADMRIYYASTHFPYEIVAMVRGGEYPYTFELNNEPAGMLVKNAGAGETCGIAQTGLVHVQCGLIYGWTPATTANDASNVELCVTDAAATTVCTTWSIDANNTKFRFMDAVNGNDANNGVLVADGGTGPRKTLLGLYNLLAANTITAFYSGTYDQTGIPVTDGDGGLGLPGSHSQMRTEWHSGTRTTQWIGIPGETVVIDFLYDHDPPDPALGYQDAVPALRFSGEFYLDNFSADNAMSKGWQLENRTLQHGVRVSRLNLGSIGPGMDGANSGWFMFTNAPGAALSAIGYGDWFQEVNWNGPHYSNIPIKWYASRAAGVVASTIRDVTASEGAIAVKGAIYEYSVVALDCQGAPTCVGGNMAELTNGAVPTSGLVAYSYLESTGSLSSEGGITLTVAKTSPITGVHDIYRTTLVGKINISSMTSGDGPFTFEQSVLVNDQAASGSCPAKFTCASVTDYTRLVRTNNLEAATADGAVDGNGNLQGVYLTNHGPDSATPKGHMLSGAVVTGPKSLPFRLATIKPLIPLQGLEP